MPLPKAFWGRAGLSNAMMTDRQDEQTTHAHLRICASYCIYDESSSHCLITTFPALVASGLGIYAFGQSDPDTSKDPSKIRISEKICTSIKA